MIFPEMKAIPLMRIILSNSLTLLLAFSFVTTMVHAAEHTKETLKTVKKNVDDETAVLVDVREQGEWDDGHVAGAIFLPLSSLQDGVNKEKLKSVPREKTLYIHCAVGKRALVAANILEKQGFTVRPLKPGYKDLISAGFPKAKD